MELYLIYYQNSILKEMPYPVEIEADSEESALALFRDKHPGYIVLRIELKLDFEEEDV